MDAECRSGLAAFRVDVFPVLSRSFQLPKDGAPAEFFRPGRIDVRPLGAPQGHVVDSSDFRLDSAGAGNAGIVQGHSGLAHFRAGRYHIHDMAITGGYLHPRYGPVATSLISGLGRFGVLVFFMISRYLIVQSLFRSDSILQFLKHASGESIPSSSCCT